MFKIITVLTEMTRICGEYPELKNPPFQKLCCDGYTKKYCSKQTLKEGLSHKKLLQMLDSFFVCLNSCEQQFVTLTTHTQATMGTIEALRLHLTKALKMHHFS